MPINLDVVCIDPEITLLERQTSAVRVIGRSCRSFWEIWDRPQRLPR